MFRVFSVCLSLFIALALLDSPAAHAGLQFDAGQTTGGLHFIVVSGDFAYEDDLSAFENLARTNGVSAVTFKSPGGNIHKAMELGRLIRKLGLNTAQFRAAECASACSLAFLGGVMRYADPGSIGVHKSSFQGDIHLSTQDAVSAVQQITADVITYMIDMGVDPALLQLSLQYDSNDIRYLSMSEMAKYRVVTSSPGGDRPAVATQVPSYTPPPPQPEPPTVASQPPPSASPSLSIPDARSGRIGYPKGSAPLKALPEARSTNVAVLRNGMAVTIIGNAGRWYRVQVGNKIGYMHDTWDQYDGGPFGRRHIQVKSFDNYAEAEAYVRSSSIPLSAYLANNGWFAITLDSTFDEKMAKSLVSEMRARGAIPDDAYATFGNTYVRKVCCQ